MWVPLCTTCATLSLQAFLPEATRPCLAARHLKHQMCISFRHMTSNQTIVVRPASVTDALAIAQTHTASWQAAYQGIFDAQWLAALSVEKRRLMWVEAIMARQPHVLVAVTGQDEMPQVLGHASWGNSRDSGDPKEIGELWSIYLDPGVWRQGLGQRLWQACRMMMFEAGMRQCRVWVLENNTDARAFYAALGFLPDTHPSKTVTMGGVSVKEVRYTLALQPPQQ
jgi:ribosomal protein S18 acetylase RimI-like enzyme